MSTTGRLQGKAALVTGAGAGIGEQICLRFSEEGASIAAMDRDGENLERVAAAVRARGGTVHAFAGDVSRAEDCDRIVEAALAALGRIDTLCNVAGIVEGGTLVEASEESWRRSHEINLKGMWHMSRRVVPHMAAAGGGSVVNIASVAGPFGVPNRGVYSVSKAGVIGLSKSLAVDFMGQGVRVNAICPGTVETPSLHDRINQSPDPERARREFIARQPMGRLGRPEEIAALAAYLAADESAYMTGQALVIDGGMTL